MKTQFIYLHGFASSPQSNKATAFRQVFNKLHLPLIIPDLENGNFQELTVSKQIAVVEEEINRIPENRLGLIGSSMGGYLAAILAERRLEVSGLYLMAPGFQFLKRWRIKLTEQYGTSIPQLIKIFHYRYNREMDLDTKIFKDAQRWDQLELTRNIPIRIAHGIHDESVDIEVSRVFASTRPHCRLKELDSDHALTSHIDWIIQDCLRFFRKEGFI